MSVWLAMQLVVEWNRSIDSLIRTMQVRFPHGKEWFVFSEY